MCPHVENYMCSEGKTWSCKLFAPRYPSSLSSFSIFSFNISHEHRIEKVTLSQHSQFSIE